MYYGTGWRTTEPGELNSNGGRCRLQLLTEPTTATRVATSINTRRPSTRDAERSKVRQDGMRQGADG